MSSQNIIDKAIDSLNEKGWRKVYGPAAAEQMWPAGSACITTALHRQAEGKYQACKPALEAISAELTGKWDDDLGSIWRFNDDPNTTIEDVLLVLKRASARLDEQTS